jgi:hypothetical protein
VLRTYEKYLLALCGLLLLTLVALILFPAGEERAVRHATQHAPPEPAESRAVDLQGAALEEKQPRANEGSSGTTSGGPTAGELLCVSPPAAGTVERSWGPTLAVAADANGRFVLYGAPRASDGGPTRDSYELLRGCSREGERLNRAAVRIGAGPVIPLGPAVLRQATYKSGSGALVSGYRPAENVSVRQELRVLPEADGTEALEVYYVVENRSDSPQQVSLFSMLTPPPSPPGPTRIFDGAPFVAPVLAMLDAEDSADPAIREERLLTGEQVGPVYVLRVGAASDASALFTPGSEGPAPDSLAIAGWREISAAPFGYEAHGEPLPENSAIGAAWREEQLDPGETLVLSGRYGYQPH